MEHAPIPSRDGPANGVQPAGVLTAVTGRRWVGAEVGCEVRQGNSHRQGLRPPGGSEFGRRVLYKQAHPTLLTAMSVRGSCKTWAMTPFQNETRAATSIFNTGRALPPKSAIVQPQSIHWITTKELPNCLLLSPHLQSQALAVVQPLHPNSVQTPKVAVLKILLFV